ncbi:MAG: hypothetical protein ACFFDH_00660 [Promethearchaeota archaeon]
MYSEIERAANAYINLRLHFIRKYNIMYNKMLEATATKDKLLLKQVEEEYKGNKHLIHYGYNDQIGKLYISKNYIGEFANDYKYMSKQLNYYIYEKIS